MIMPLGGECQTKVSAFRHLPKKQFVIRNELTTSLCSQTRRFASGSNDPLAGRDAMSSGRAVSCLKPVSALTGARAVLNLRDSCSAFPSSLLFLAEGDPSIEISHRGSPL
jgi:hypothetical protein